MRGSNEAGWVRYMRVSKARLVCEEVSLVHGLVERSIILLPHLLLAAPRRDEVEATPASQLRAFSNPAKAIGKVTVLPGCRRCVRRSPARARRSSYGSALVPAAHFSCVAVSLDVPRGGWSVQPAVSSHVQVHSSTHPICILRVDRPPFAAARPFGSVILGGTEVVDLRGCRG